MPASQLQPLLFLFRLLIRIGLYIATDHCRYHASTSLYLSIYILRCIYVYVRIEEYSAFTLPPRSMHTTENNTLCISHI